MLKRCPSLDCDVTVDGAGPAGIAAARMLTDAGLRVIVLEARNRISGRVFTRYKRRRPVEMGGELIHGNDTITEKLAKQYDLTLEEFPAYGCSSVEGVLRRDRKMEHPPSTVVGDLRTAAANLRREGRGGITVDQLLEHPAGISVMKRYPLITKTFVQRLVSNDFGADPSVLSLDAFLAPNVTGYDANFRIKEGYSELFKRMSAGLDIRLKHPVREIDWGEGYVKTFTPRGVFQSKESVVTLPIGVLQNGDVRFHPALPKRTWQAMESIDPGAASKSVLSFRSNFKGYPFWPANMGVMASDRRSQLWWETQSCHGPGSQHLLTNLTGGSECNRLAAMNDEEREDRLLSQLECIFSRKQAFIRQYFLELFDWRDWAHDPYARGAYSAAPEDASLELTRRVGPLRFAGEAVGTREPGNVASVHGAILSGRYAAMKILANLR